VPTVWRADAACKRARQAVVEATAEHMNATAEAYARILAAERPSATAEAGQRRVLELEAMDETELDQLWVKADLIGRFAELGYPRERLGEAGEEQISSTLRRGPRRRVKEVAVLHDLITSALGECRGLLHDPLADVSVQDVVDVINAKKLPDHQYTVRTLMYRLRHWRELWDAAWHNWPKGFRPRNVTPSDEETDGGSTHT
jgi:hypothetical protein